MLRMSEERPPALKLDSGCGSVPCALCKCPVGVFTAPAVQPEGLVTSVSETPSERRCGWSHLHGCRKLNTRAVCLCYW